MNKIMERITANRLKDFSGLSIEGELPVSEEMINEVLRLFMGKMEKSSLDQEASVSSANENQTDFSGIINMLDVKDVKIGLKEKKAVLKLNIRKY
ncbi:MAG TPA: hypothetical protein VKA38_09275 [Draconibacterium sp.]|nr:hypothetical protein [Draconibacterium sp.]